MYNIMGDSARRSFKSRLALCASWLFVSGNTHTTFGRKVAVQFSFLCS